MNPWLPNAPEDPMCPVTWVDQVKGDGVNDVEMEEDKDLIIVLAPKKKGLFES